MKGVEFSKERRFDVMDDKFVELIEHIGYVNEYGERIYGTAALLHFLHCPVKSLDKRYIEIGKAYVQKRLSA